MIGLVSALATILGVALGVLMFLRDRAELRELESVTNLLERGTSRDAELAAIQQHLLDRYLRTAKRRVSGTNRMIWALLTGAVGAVAYLTGGGSAGATLLSAGAFVVALVLIAPFYVEIVRDLYGAIAKKLRGTIHAGPPRSE